MPFTKTPKEKVAEIERGEAAPPQTENWENLCALNDFGRQADRQNFFKRRVLCTV